MRVIKINNIKLQNFLEERGIEPLYEDYITQAAVYKRTKQLALLLESYSVVTCAFRNAL